MAKVPKVSKETKVAEVTKETKVAEGPEDAKVSKEPKDPKVFSRDWWRLAEMFKRSQRSQGIQRFFRIFGGDWR